MGKEQLIEKLIQEGFLRSPCVIEAFNQVDRAAFVPAQYRAEAYADYPLPIGFGQTISQPATVAFMLEHLQPKPGEKILEIGAGSGWQTALLAYLVTHDPERPAELADEPGKIIAVEILPMLKDMAADNLTSHGYIEKGIVQVELGDGANGWAAEAPFHKIISAAASDYVRVAWKNQLRLRGRLVVPVKDTIKVLDKVGQDEFREETYRGFRFVPLVTDEGDGA